jgi:glycosyltransferase involved in cell wall biosynthesis
VNCPSLNELPAPPAGRFGWPWTEESVRLPKEAAAAGSLPVISVITPSYNQGSYLEETIRSVLLQGYPKLEYIVMDGGSKDESLAIIRKYSPWLTYWVSEPDAGQSDAINRGLSIASGAWATWINSDDMLCKNALVEQARRFGFDKHTVYLGNCVYINETGDVLSEHCGRVHNLKDLLKVSTVWRTGGQIVQPEVVFPRELALSVGGLNRDNHYTMDYELWGKLLLRGATFQYTQIPFGKFREHPAQKTHDPDRVTLSLLETAAKLVGLAVTLSSEAKKDFLADLYAYRLKYERESWRGTGRLARFGLPRGIVTQLRNLKTSLQKRTRTNLKKIFAAN